MPLHSEGQQGQVASLQSDFATRLNISDSLEGWDGTALHSAQNSSDERFVESAEWCLPPSRQPTLQWPEVKQKIEQAAPSKSCSALNSASGRSGKPQFVRPIRQATAPIRDFGQEVDDAMMKINLGLDGMTPYISLSDLNALITKDGIKRSLIDTTSDFDNKTDGQGNYVINFLENNPVLFAIVLLSLSGKDERLDAIISFCQSDLTDQCLPVNVNALFDPGSCKVIHTGPRFWGSGYEVDGGPVICSLEPNKPCPTRSRIGGACTHIEQFDGFHDPVWSSTALRTFQQKQKSFFSVKFEQDTFMYELDSNDVLPFISRPPSRTNTTSFTESTATTQMQKSLTEVGVAPFQGYFGKVFPVEMLSDHQDVMDRVGDKIWVAIKELQPVRHETYDVRSGWEREAVALKTFNTLHDLHIVKGIGAFKQTTNPPRYHLIMEWADGGSLEKLWKDSPNPGLSSNLILEILEQFTGLANALSRMHNFGMDENTVLRKANPNQENWRHSDFKPDNILSFKVNGTSLGTLKIADLGRAKFHEKDTAHRFNGTSERFGHWRYEPPEVWTARETARSRLYDVWSFGCVLLEMLLWALYGHDALRNFGKNCDGQQGSPYWTWENFARRTAKINDDALRLMNHILTHDSECNKNSAMRDLIKLVRDELLVLMSNQTIGLPKQRMKCDQLLKELKTIRLRAAKQPSYLHTQSDRFGDVKPWIVETSQDEGSTEGGSRTTESILSSTTPTVNVEPVGELESTDVSEAQECRSSLDPGDIQMFPGNIAIRRTPSPSYGRPMDTYRHDFDDYWQFEHDNAFAKTAALVVHGEHHHIASKGICDACIHIDFANPTLTITDTLDNLQQRAGQGCPFCSMRLRIINNRKLEGTVEFKRCPSGLKLSFMDKPAISLSRSANIANFDSPFHQNQTLVPIGSPRIPKIGSAAQFRLLKLWLEDCDRHEKCSAANANSGLPKRAVSVGTPESPELRLIEPAQLRDSDRANFEYIALSYSWGDTALHPHAYFETTTSNIEQYSSMINVDLPHTLRDAVSICRALGKHYIWIDSLCIIQGSDGDFVQEAARMDSVFSSAFCVLAATSVEGSHSGMLSRSSPRELGQAINSEIVDFPIMTSAGCQVDTVFISTFFDDFESDVRRGRLNTRGWAYQERALARRTIHFTNNQVYWECGEGIRCETLTKMHNDFESFLGDANFPEYGLQFHKGGDIAFTEHLYEQYSTLLFSHPEDRPVAIAGLEQRLIKALQDKHGLTFGCFGISDRYPVRGLMWQRASTEQRLSRLETKKAGGTLAPSWSWMGHSGGISFMKPDPHSVQWLNEEVILPWTNQASPLGTSSYRGELGLRGMARSFKQPKGTNSFQADIVFDDLSHFVELINATENPWPHAAQDLPHLVDAAKLKCILVGREILTKHRLDEVRHYALIVAPTELRGAQKVYKRVGAGLLYGSVIDFSESPLQVLVD